MSYLKSGKVVFAYELDRSGQYRILDIPVMRSISVTGIYM
jgi:hypothetical protein